MEYWKWEESLYKEELKKALYDVITCKVILYTTGHTLETHTEKTDQELVERLIKENKEFSTCFYEIENNPDFDDYSLYQAIIDGLTYKIDEIADWIKNDRSSSFKVSVNVMDEPIGYGYDKELKKYKSPYISIVLERDCNEYNNYGFYVKTAYPEISMDMGIETGERYDTELVLQSDNIEKYEKIRGLLNTQFANNENITIRVSKDKKTNEKFLKITASIGKDETFVANIYENNQTINHFSLNERERLTEQKLSDIIKNSDYKYSEKEIDILNNFVNAINMAKTHKQFIEIAEANKAKEQINKNKNINLLIQ